jgi:hypothetical protein
LISLAGVAALIPACRSRAFHTHASQPRAVKTGEIPHRFVVLSGHVTGLRDVGARLTGLTATLLVQAENASRPGCAAATEGGAPDASEARAEYPGWQLSPSGELRFLARARVSPSDGAFETHVPTRIGWILERCRFRPKGGLALVFEALTADGKLVTFSKEVDMEDIRAGLKTGRAMTRHFRWPDSGELLSARSSAMEAGESSFADIRERIEATREIPGPLASEPGLSTAAIGKGIVGNALGIDLRDERVRADQTRILVSRSEVRESTTKAFHPFGVCAFARWKTTPDSPWSGLFAPGIDLPIVVRLSGAGNNTTTKADFGLVHRMLGLAVKIFPAQTPETKV